MRDAICLVTIEPTFTSEIFGDISVKGWDQIKHQDEVCGGQDVAATSSTSIAIDRR
jgi:hypothetical protein